MAERLADGLIGEPEQDAAFEAAWEVVSQIPVGSMAGEAPWAAADTLSHDKDADWADLRVDRRHWYTKYASSVLEKAANAVAFTEGDNEELISRRNSEAIAQFELLSDFVRPRRRDMQLTPSSLAWNGGLITRFAQSIYEDRDFQRFPILADALEESGCTDVEILSHCRSPGPHARGCWVVDLFLGKE